MEGETNASLVNPNKFILVVPSVFWSSEHFEVSYPVCMRHRRMCNFPDWLSRRGPIVSLLCWLLLPTVIWLACLVGVSALLPNLPVLARRGEHSEFVFTRRGKAIARINNSGWKAARRRASKRYASEVGRSCPNRFRSIRVHDLKHTYGHRLRAASVGFEDRKLPLGHKAGLDFPGFSGRFGVFVRLFRIPQDLRRLNDYGGALDYRKSQCS
jgi:hypothetical protein